jgi:hypothetical protein
MRCCWHRTSGTHGGLFSGTRPNPFSPSAFAREVSKATESVIELASDVSLAVYPARPASVRGVRLVSPSLTTAGFLRLVRGPGSRQGNAPGDRRPCHDGRKAVDPVEPLPASGALFDLHRAHYGQGGSSTLVWQASAPEMNMRLFHPATSRGWPREDPEGFRSEVLGEFRTGLSTLIDPDALDACVVADRRELAPSREVSYRAFVDPSGGRSDAFSVAVGHRSSSTAGLDVVRGLGRANLTRECDAEASELLSPTASRLSQETGTAASGHGKLPILGINVHELRRGISPRLSRPLARRELRIRGAAGHAGHAARAARPGASERTLRP